MSIYSSYELLLLPKGQYGLAPYNIAINNDYSLQQDALCPHACPSQEMNSRTGVLRRLEVRNSARIMRDNIAYLVVSQNEGSPKL